MALEKTKKENVIRLKKIVVTIFWRLPSLSTTLTLDSCRYRNEEENALATDPVSRRRRDVSGEWYSHAQTAHDAIALSEPHDKLENALSPRVVPDFKGVSSRERYLRISMVKTNSDYLIRCCDCREC
jgi:hypothetical protein